MVKDHDQDGRLARSDELENYQDRGLKVYKVCINDDPSLTLTYYTARSNLVAYVFCGYNVRKSFNRK